MPEFTRQDVDLAYSEIAAIIGAPESVVRAAALELSAGPDSAGNVTFTSLQDEAQAVAELVRVSGHTAEEMVGLAGPELDGMAALSVADEVAGIISRAPWREFHDRQGQLRTQPMADFGKASQALLPARPELPAEPARLTAEGRAEVERYLALSQAKRPVYGAAPKNTREREHLALTSRRIDEYVELGADGSSRTYTSNNGSVTVTEYDVTNDGQTWTGDEIDRLVDKARGLFGTSPAPLVNTTGNASYAPGPESEWGQFRKGPWHSEYDGAA
jgi:hypothetical protein